MTALRIAATATDGVLFLDGSLTVVYPAPYTIGSEVVEVVGGSGTANISVRRGIGGSTAASHLAGAALTAANAFSGGGDTRVVVDLSVAQLRALWTVPIQAIAAPGAGKQIVLKWGFWQYTFVTTAYALALVVPAFDGSAIPLTVETPIALDVTESRTQFQPLTSYTEAASHINKAVFIIADPNGIDPGQLGDGTLRITLDYEVITLA